METAYLKQALAELRTALASGQPLDADLITMLTALDADIKARFLQDGDDAPDATIESAGLTTRAQEISAKFAAEHPHLEPVLRELTNTLNRIGI
ncbi:MAG: DUF4404 family protein [Pseudomonadota bacterium]